MQRLTGLLLFGLFGPPPCSAQTVLTLPFFNPGGDKAVEWAGESLAEAIFESVSAAGLLAVRRETRDGMLKEMNIRRYAPLTKASVIEIAVNLSADVVVYGELEHVPDSASGGKGEIRAAARILYLNPMRNGPEMRESGRLEELFELQNRLARRVLPAIPGAAAAPEGEPGGRPSLRLEALESYIRGLLAESAGQKIQFFGNAARLEPGFSQPCFQLGKLYAARREWKAAAEWLARAGPHDPDYREALFRLALARHHRGEYAAAAEALEKLAGLIPLGEVFSNLGVAQLRAGEPGAVETLRRALEADPSDPVYRFNLGYAQWRRGDFDAAEPNLRAALDRDPNDESAALLLERCRKRAGPRPGDPRTEGLERLKANYDETAWRHLQAMLERKPGNPD
jgi:tetratricopeptide (TPR) repeat protein